jgi:hypothetical protein
MAASQISNVLIAAADGDTFTGAQDICRIKCSAGSNAGTVTVKVSNASSSNVAVYTQQLSANSSPVSDELILRVTPGQTLTVNMSATGITVYLYRK